MQYIFNHKWIVEVLLALPGVVLVMVSVLLGVIGEVMVHVVGYGGVECGWVGRGQGVGHVIYGWHKPIPIIINHKFTRPSSISTLGTSRSTKLDSQFLRNLIFIPIGKCSRKHKLFSALLVSYDRWDLEPSIHIKKIPKMFHIFFWQTIQKCQLFFETLGRANCVVVIQMMYSWFHSLIFCYHNITHQTLERCMISSATKSRDYG